MAIRNSQDVTLALAQNPGSPRDSQDLILVLTKTVVSGTISDSQAAQTLDASGVEENTIGTVQASQTLAVSGAQIIKLRDSQDVILALAQNPGTPRDSQDVILVLTRTVYVGTISDSQSSQSLAASGTQALPPGPDKPSIQLHPLVKPLDFLSRPLTQAGKRASSFSTFLTEPGANRAFSMPLGARNQPIAGKVFAFTMGGTITPGTVGGSMVITPLYGATSDGVNLGSSAIQFYPASINALPWRLKGEIIFQTVDLTPGTALVVCSGVFMMSGDPTLADSGVELLFGSVNPIQVDLSAVVAVASGALNFAVSFGPSVFNVTPPTISTKYAFLRRL